MEREGCGKTQKLQQNYIEIERSRERERATKRDTPEIGSLRREREREKKRVDRKEDQTELEKRKDSRAEERDRVKSHTSIMTKTWLLPWSS